MTTNMLLTLLVVASALTTTTVALPIITGSECASVNGSWYDEYGSELHINEEPDGLLSGIFTTHLSSQKNRTSEIIGVLPYDIRNATFSLVFLTNDDAWTGTMAGQCILCENEETLQTSWLRRSQVDECEDKWESTIIGVSYFKRYPPPQLSGSAHGSKRSVLTSPMEEANEMSGKRPSEKQDEDLRANGPCLILGDWYNTLGSTLHISERTADNVIEGYYQTAVESEPGAAGPDPSYVRGTAIDGKSYTLIAFNVLWNNGSSTTGFVGQCHVCGLNNTEAIQTSWILRTKVADCEDNWHSTRYGEDFFTRYKQSED